VSSERYLFNSESVTEGHPDKLADQISDRILDTVLAQDPGGRVAAETLVTTGLVLVTGEISTSVQLDIPSIVRETVKKVVYTSAAYGFDADTCAVVGSATAMARRPIANRQPTQGSSSLAQVALRYK
jgi:S-adenosylmethionine synthetase